MTRHIKPFLLLAFFGASFSVASYADDTNPENLLPPEEEAVSKSVVEEPPEPARMVQIPVFKNGKWDGYREEPLEPERKPSGEMVLPTETGQVLTDPASSETTSSESPSLESSPKSP